MKILHLCLASFYIDNYGYQENILPKYHKTMGHDVQIIASTETYISNKTLGYVKPSEYYNNDGIKVTRIPYVRWLPRKLSAKLRLYEGLERLLEEVSPNIIFMHDTQFYDILRVKKYALKNKTLVYADSHTDSINSARNVISLFILHKLYYRFLVQRADCVIKRYFPTLPLRAKFLEEIYGIDANKMTLLPFGSDDAEIQDLDRVALRTSIRSEYGISDDELLIITGGKIDLRKNIHILLAAFSILERNKEIDDVSIFVFGQISDEVIMLIREIELSDKIIFLGWLDTKAIAKYLIASDCAIYPGTHSVIWEETIGLGIPAIFKRWDAMQHLDLGGNAIFIEDTSIEGLSKLLVNICNDRWNTLEIMKNVAMSKGIDTFAYSMISKKSLEL